MYRKIHSINTLSDLYHLPSSEIEEFLLAEGRPCFDITGGNFLVFIPSLDSFVEFDDLKHNSIKNQIVKSDFTLRQEEVFIKISYPKGFSTAFLLLDDFEEYLEQFIDLDENVSFLISDRLDVPLFVGNTNVIQRLADDFDGADGVLSIKNFSDWKKNNV